MDRRTKFILLVLASIILLAAVFYFIVWPLLKPVIPGLAPAQPPAAPAPRSPVVNVQGGTPGGATGTVPVVGGLEVIPERTPDQLRIAELKSRAGILSERVESGSSANEFQNYEDAALDVGASIAEKFRTMRESLVAAHPSTGPTYFTIARRLIEIPENENIISGSRFVVRVQMQVQVHETGTERTEYHESTVTFSLTGSAWVVTDYSVQPFTP